MRVGLTIYLLSQSCFFKVQLIDCQLTLWFSEPSSGATSNWKYISDKKTIASHPPADDQLKFPLITRIDLNNLMIKKKIFCKGNSEFAVLLMISSWIHSLSPHPTILPSFLMVHRYDHHLHLKSSPSSCLKCTASAEAISPPIRSYNK